MTKGLVLFIGLALAGAAQAQIKCWTGADGKRACGDTPPPGARLETPKGAPAPKVSSPAPAPKVSAPAPAAPVTKAREAPELSPEDRKRVAEAHKAATKGNLKAPSNVNMQECERAREMLRAMGGGGRSQRTDAVNARALAEENCP